MSVRDILDGYGDELGWNEDSKFLILCEYVDNQQSEDALEDFVARRAAEEKAESDEFERDLREDR